MDDFSNKVNTVPVSFLFEGETKELKFFIFEVSVLILLW